MTLPLRGSSEGAPAFRKGDRVMIDGDPTHTGTVRWVVDPRWTDRTVAVGFGPGFWASYAAEQLTLVSRPDVSSDDQHRRAA